MNSYQRLLIVTLGVLAVGGLGAREAHACDVGPPPPHALDPDAQETDRVAPALPPPAVYRIKRGHGNDGCSADSCAGMAAIAISVSATDDATPPAKIGYRLTLLEGTLPHDMQLPATAIRTIEDGQLWLDWGDGDSDDQESFVFTLQVVAIDLAGNESAPQTLMIADGGSGGCRLAGRAPPLAPGTLAGLLLALAALARRRPRHRQRTYPRSSIGLLVALAVGALAARPARACSFGDTPHTLDPEAQASDHVAPTLASPTLVRITRGQGSSGCGGSGSSCDDIGSIGVSVPATDDATPAAQIGFRLSVVGGTPPGGIPTQAVRASNGELWLHWADGNSGDQEAFAFTLQVVAIDLAGNESAPQTLLIADGGSGGCRVAGRAPPLTPGTFAGLLVALAALARRRPRGVRDGAPRA